MSKKKDKSKAGRKHKPAEVLESWRYAVKVLSRMNESDLKAALDAEAAKPQGERREDLIMRLHRRYCKLRNKRELEVLLQNPA